MNDVSIDTCWRCVSLVQLDMRVNQPEAVEWMKLPWLKQFSVCGLCLYAPCMVEEFNMRVDAVFTTLALMYFLFLSGIDSDLIMSVRHYDIILVVPLILSRWRNDYNYSSLFPWYSYEIECLTVNRVQQSTVICIIKWVHHWNPNPVFTRYLVNVFI